MANTATRAALVLTTWVATAALCEIAALGSPASAASSNIRFHEGTSAHDIPFAYEQMHISEK